MKLFKIASVLFIMLLCFWAKQSVAQKGAFMLYGSLNYQNNNNAGATFGANPIGLGYFFNDHVVAGANYGFAWEKNPNHDMLYSHHEAGPFYSDSWLLGQYFVLIAQLDTHYVWGQQAMQTSDAYRYNGFLLRLYPIVGVMLGHGWTLKAKFSELSFERTKGNNPAHTVDKTFILGANGSTLGIGVSKNILFKKH